RAKIAKTVNSAELGKTAKAAESARSAGLAKAARTAKAAKSVTSTWSSSSGARSAEDSDSHHFARPHARKRAGGPPLIRLTNADVHLDEFKALHAIAFEVHRGDCWVIHGPNGSGKTTLLRTLYGDHGVASHGSIEREGIVPGVPLQEFKVCAGF